MLSMADLSHGESNRVLRRARVSVAAPAISEILRNVEESSTRPWRKQGGQVSGPSGAAALLGIPPIHSGVKDQIDEHQQIQLQDERPDFITNFANLRTDGAFVTRKRGRLEELTSDACVALDRSEKAKPIGKEQRNCFPQFAETISAKLA